MRRILLAFTFVVVALSAFADMFDRPAEVRLVVDSASAFTPKQLDALTAKLDSFEQATTVQIQIFTTTDLHGYDVVDFAQRLGEGWGVGQADKNNGIVIVYKPKTLFEDGEVTIQTGYGIESLIPDAVCKQIIDNEMIPCFKKGHIYMGIDRAVDVCISLTGGEYTAEKYMADIDRLYTIAVYIIIGLVAFPIVVVVIFLIVFLFCCRGYTASSNSSSGSSSGSSGSSSSRSSGSYRTTTHHHSSSHRSYGGGHFGGGGARGRW
jgi:uncharacterized protein